MRFFLLLVAIIFKCVICCSKIEEIDFQTIISENNCSQGLVILRDGQDYGRIAIKITKSIYNYKRSANENLSLGVGPVFKITGTFEPCKNYEMKNGTSGNCIPWGNEMSTGYVDQNICFIENVCPEVPPSCDPNAEDCSPSCNPDIECCELDNPSNKCSAGKDLGD